MVFVFISTMLDIKKVKLFRKSRAFIELSFKGGIHCKLCELKRCEWFVCVALLLLLDFWNVFLVILFVGFWKVSWESKNDEY